MKLILPTLVLGLVLGGAAVYKTGLTSAHFSEKNKEDMSEKLAGKLNVSKDQVTGAMEQIRTENQEKRKAAVSANLDKAVADVVITAEQKQKLLDHQAEKQKKMEEQMASEKKWVEESGIDFSKLKAYDIGIGIKFGDRGHWKK